MYDESTIDDVYLRGIKDSLRNYGVTFHLKFKG